MVDPVAEFKEGLAALQSNLPAKALRHFSRALELDKTNPFYISYQGLAKAVAEHDWQVAEDLCAQAVKMRRTQAELHINLAEVYRLAGKRQDAIDALSQGLIYTKRDPRIEKALRRFGTRREPVIPFLERDNLLNRGLGTLRHKIQKSFRAKGQGRTKSR